MSLQSKIASWGGDVWMPRDADGKTLMALSIKPAIISGVPHFKLDADDYRCFTKFVQPGDMAVMTGDVWLLSNRGIANTAFKHLAVYTGAISGVRDEETRMILKARSMGAAWKHSGEPGPGIWERTFTHAISEGVVTQDILEVMNHFVDYMAFVRPWKTEKEQQKIVDFALDKVGLGYNFDFTPDGPTELYCTELGVQACEAAGIAPPEKVKINVSWKGYIPGMWTCCLHDVTLADYFLKTFPTVAVSKSCASRELVKNSRIPDVLRVALNNAPDFRTMHR